MKRRSERILTTHTGSLPRPKDLERLMLDKSAGKPVDPALLDARVRSAVAEAVERQLAVGIDVVNDGEMSKVGFCNYVQDRLSGFGGRSERTQMGDLVDYPELFERIYGDAEIVRPACDGPITVVDDEAVARDLDNFRAVLAGREPTEAFLTAASPGVVAFHSDNEYYPSYKEYLLAIADAMKPEYDAIAGAGFVLQLDCPDLALAGHVQFLHKSREEFRRRVALNLEALDHAVRDIPPERLRLHLCWGNYPGPHHRDVPLRDIIDLVLRSRPGAISFEAANPRHEHEWTIFEELELAEENLLIPGVIDSVTNHIEHPELVAQRISRFAELVGRERVIAGTDCGFGTFVGWSAVDPEVAWAKLRTLVEGAELASLERKPALRRLS